MLIYERMKQVSLPLFKKNLDANLKESPLVVTLFGKPYFFITKITEEVKGKTVGELLTTPAQSEALAPGEEPFYFDPYGQKTCKKHNVAWPLCDCPK